MNSRSVLTLSVLCLAAGCAGTRHSDFQSTRSLTVVEPSEDADRLWNAIQDTLRAHRYSIDRVDRAAGVITTLPETSKHVLEFWRNDVATARDAWESTINPIRRWVEVTLAGGEGAWSDLSIVVHKERFSSPDRQFNSTGAAYQFFGDSLPSTTGHYRVTVSDDRWLDLGRDPAMEDRLIRDIAKRCPEAETPAAGP